MLAALKELGDHLRKRDKTGLDYFLTLSKLSNTTQIICIDFEWDGNEAHYRGVHLEHAGNKEKTLYSGGTSRGGDYSPTSLITFKGPEKALARIWRYGWFAKYKGDDPLVNALKTAYQRKKKKINADVIEEYGKLHRLEKRGCLLTINIVEDGDEKYLDSFEVFRQVVKENVLGSWVKKHNTESCGQGECTICKQRGDLFGFGFPFPFRSFDKIGFAPEFKVENAWKQLPLCFECAYSMRAAQSFLDENSFKTQFGNIEYYIVPEFPVNPPSEDIIDFIIRGKSKKSKYAFISTEDYYTEMILGQENIAMNLIFLFFTRSQSQQRIEKYVEDVPPSWIKQLYKAKVDIETLPLFQEKSLKKIVNKKQEGGWKFKTLDGIIYSVLPDRKEIYDFKELALYLMGNILRGEKVNSAILFDMYSRELKRRYTKDLKGEISGFYERPVVYSLNSFMFMLFLFRSGLLEGEKMNGENEITLNESQKRFEEFFQAYPVAFDSAEKRGVFLEGVLVKYLMRVQYARRRSTPFRSKLSGLNLNIPKVKKLLGEVEEKLSEYEVSYPSLSELTSIYLLKAEENGWAISRDEIIYYFALGMNLSGLFKKESEKNE